MENVNKYITSIAQIALNNLPVEEGWEDFTVKVFAVKKMIEINAFYSTTNDKRISFNPKNINANNRNEDLTFLFMDLRKTMYELTPNKGAWYSAEIKINKTGKFNTHFDYDNMPNFAYTPNDEKFVDDYKNFPREISLIPQWLKEILEKSKVVFPLIAQGTSHKNQKFQPETMKNAEVGISFEKFDLLLPTKIKTFQEMDTNYNYYGGLYPSYYTLVDIAFHYQDRDDLMPFTHPGGYLETKDLRFNYQKRENIYNQINEDINIPYYDLALKHGFDLGRFYE